MHLKALVAYLQGLRENNNKAWFVMNKPAYDILRAEFQAVVARVVTGLAKHDPRIGDVDPRKALFRIYRDIRFSNDKTPYKTNFSASIAEAGAKNSGPMYYFHIDAQGSLHLGAGCYLPQADVLKKLRQHAIDDDAGIARVLKGRRFASTFGTLSTADRLVRLPKGYDPERADVQKAGELLRLKSFVVSADVDLTAEAGAADGEALAGTIVRIFAAAVPLNDWLRAALALQPDATQVDEATLSERPSPTRTKRATSKPTS